MKQVITILLIQIGILLAGSHHVWAGQREESNHTIVPGEKRWKGRGGELYLKELIFLPNGKTFEPWWTWTKGLVFHSGDKIASKYVIKNIDGSTYVFCEWKSGDYTIRHQKPSCYVLKKNID